MRLVPAFVFTWLLAMSGPAISQVALVSHDFECWSYYLSQRENGLIARSNCGTSDSSMDGILKVRDDGLGLCSDWPNFYRNILVSPDASYVLSFDAVFFAIDCQIGDQDNHYEARFWGNDSVNGLEIMSNSGGLAGLLDPICDGSWHHYTLDFEGSALVDSFGPWDHNAGLYFGGTPGMRLLDNLQLVEYSAVPVQSTCWGSLKAIYRH